MLANLLAHILVSNLIRFVSYYLCMAASSHAALAKGEATINRLSTATGRSQAEIMGVVRVLGGAMIGIAVLVVVLNEVFSLDAINDSNGSFTGVIDSLKSTGGAALGLLVIGLLVLAANRVMGFFGGGGF